MASDLYTYRDERGEMRTVRLDGSHLDTPLKVVGYSEERYVSRQTYNPREVEVTWQIGDREPIRFSGQLDGAFIETETDPPTIVGLLAPRIAHDADVESIWPTLAEVGRPWR